MKRLGFKKILADSIAIAEKDLKLDMRFKIPFFFETVVMPIAVLAPFILVYFGYFQAGNVYFAGLEKENFVVFLLLGMLSSIALHQGFNNFLDKFLREKYWQTIEGIAITPINRISLVIGGTINGVISVLPSAVIIFFIGQFFLPTSIAHSIQILLLLILLLLTSMSLGLVAALTAVFNENYSPVFRYFIIAITFFSCFYYPISLFDSHPFLALLKPLIEINPFYHGVTIMRSIWFFGVIPWASFLYVLIFSIILPFISVFVFNRAWKIFTIQGY